MRRSLLKSQTTRSACGELGFLVRLCARVVTLHHARRLLHPAALELLIRPPSTRPFPRSCPPLLCAASPGPQRPRSDMARVCHAVQHRCQRAAVLGHAPPTVVQGHGEGVRWPCKAVRAEGEGCYEGCLARPSLAGEKLTHLGPKCGTQPTLGQCRSCAVNANPLVQVATHALVTDSETLWH